MAGGTWRIQNKVRPGVYINVKGDGKPVLTTPLGRLLMFQNKPLGWGKNGIIELKATSDFTALTGHNSTDEVFLSPYPTKESSLPHNKTLFFSLEKLKIYIQRIQN